MLTLFRYLMSLRRTVARARRGARPTVLLPWPYSWDTDLDDHELRRG